MASIGMALALMLFIFYNGRYGVLDVKYAKGQKLLKETFVKWNSYSRIAIAPERGSGAPMIFIDADASTGIGK